jgi:hypothetical protein
MSMTEEETYTDPGADFIGEWDVPPPKRRDKKVEPATPKN